MSRFQIGTILEPWVDIEPPISSKSEDFVHKSPESNPHPSPDGDQNGLEMIDSDIHTNEAARSFTTLAEKQDIERALRNYPSLDPATQREITLKFRKLHAKVRKQGLYDCHYSNYLFDLMRYLLLLGLFVFFFTRGFHLISACFLGFFWQQIMFVAHDAGHLAITHNTVIDTLLGIFVADLCCGLSLGWWKSSHNVHHLVPNHPVSLPFLSSLMLIQ